MVISARYVRAKWIVRSPHVSLPYILRRSVRKTHSPFVMFVQENGAVTYFWWIIHQRLGVEYRNFIALCGFFPALLQQRAGAFCAGSARALPHKTIEGDLAARPRS